MLEESKTDIAASNAANQRSNTNFLMRWGEQLFGSKRDFQTNFTLLLMALPGLILIFIFAYLPMFGLIIAFKDYRFAEGILGSEWVGFDNFRFLFGTDTAWRITRNTLLMNGLFIATGTIGSLTIAILTMPLLSDQRLLHVMTHHENHLLSDSNPRLPLAPASDLLLDLYMTPPSQAYS